MKSGFVLFLVFAAYLSTGCNSKTEGVDLMDSLSKAEQEHWEFLMPDTAAMRKQFTVIEIKTSLGNLELVLFDATPLHKANFIKLVDNGFYTNLLFHRVKKDFMVQGGDPHSRNAAKNTQLGQGGPGYTIDAEILDTLFHYKGALAAARSGFENPEKKSSGSQFYIVTGEKQGTLAYKNAIKNRVFSAFLEDPDNLSFKLRYNTYQNRQDMAAMNVLFEEIDREIKGNIDSLYNSIPENTRRIYATWGGFPGLDMDYTVFGFLISGYDVLDKIQNVNTNADDRPVEDVKILSARVIKRN